MSEVWKTIEGFEGRYEVSNIGRIRSFMTNTGAIRERPLILCQKIDKYGYLVVGLNKNGKKNFRAVHRLVALAFIPNTGNLPQINHKNEDKQDNRVENLEWCTVSYNNNYGTHSKRISNSMKNNPKISRAVLQCDKDGSIVNEYPSTHEAARANGYTKCGIVACIHGKMNTYKGFYWKYK